MKTLPLIAAISSSLLFAACVPEIAPPDTDSEFATTWYADTDFDGYGDPEVSQEAVDQPDDYVADNTDCNDGDIDVNPGETDINDDKDNNCDGTINDGPYNVGDRGPAGGWVFAVSELSDFHGLEAAPEDQDDGSGAEWGCEGITITSGNGAQNKELGAGYANTLAHLEDCPDTGTAAKLVNAYTINGFDDWFLPSKDELNAMHTHLHINVLGGFTNNAYRSSSEFNMTYAWVQKFEFGNQFHINKFVLYRVRAARAF
ncbi:Uncharacterised protein [BD1-7 clade bacterium]|uniref:DUF1566 domain-containing protein n=1 Tax=BD1-7 clade bacterium TaxID=2029982 RepID=A0A5S9P8I4_9GAMM|nr:Uncharacterised protein [BD1-7 clade bacterium]CAA0099715.1 Uncharacterised protein [BD1-7 clade bacterium]